MPREAMLARRRHRHGCSRHHRQHGGAMKEVEDALKVAAKDGSITAMVVSILLTLVFMGLSLLTSLLRIPSEQ
jgi:hypothetical protein